jgi:hypothetical protein
MYEPGTETRTQIPGQAPWNLTYKLTPSVLLSFQREGEVPNTRDGGEFINILSLKIKVRL